MRAARACLVCAACAATGCGSLLGLDPPPDSYWSFADDFESRDFSHWTKANQVPNSTLEVAQIDDAPSGCCAMHVKIDSGASGYAYALLTFADGTPMAPPPLMSGTIAIRAQIKAVAVDHDTREMSIASNADQPGDFITAGLGIPGPGPGATWGFVLTDSVTAGLSGQSTEVIDTNWHCSELVINVDQTHGNLAVFVDGAATPVVQNEIDTTTGKGWNSAQLGLNYTSGMAASELYFDDAEVALYRDLSPTIHLGCD